jgi:hypothetical protein
VRDRWSWARNRDLPEEGATSLFTCCSTLPRGGENLAMATAGKHVRLSDPELPGLYEIVEQRRPRTICRLTGPRRRCRRLSVAAIRP